MNILSLFDGISCARVALERSGIQVNKYYASEIDKYAIQVSKNNYPDIIHLGDVRQVNGYDLHGIDLLIGGSPCQDLSIAKRNRKGLEGDRSGLFYEYVRILNEVKPKYFILENVASMPKEAKEVITSILGVEPVMINAALVSAQSRKRLFWTNIKSISLPGDRGILLKDVLESGESGDNKSLTITATYDRACPADYFKGRVRQLIFEDPLIYQKNRGYNNGGIKAKDGKVPTLTSSYWQENNLLAQKCLGNVNPSGKGMNGGVYGVDAKSPTLTMNKGEGIKVLTPISSSKLVDQIGKEGQGQRVYSVIGKSVCLSANGGGNGRKRGSIRSIYQTGNTFLGSLLRLSAKGCRGSRMNTLMVYPIPKDIVVLAMRLTLMLSPIFFPLYNYKLIAKSLKAG